MPTVNYFKKHTGVLISNRELIKKNVNKFLTLFESDTRVNGIVFDRRQESVERVNFIYDNLQLTIRITIDDKFISYYGISDSSENKEETRNSYFDEAIPKTYKKIISLIAKLAPNT